MPDGQSPFAGLDDGQAMTRAARKPRGIRITRAGAFIAVVLLIALGGWLQDTQRGSRPDTASRSSVPSAKQAAPSLPAFLPLEARTTLDLIARGGPYPHPQDDQPFGNREGLLAAQPPGHYREYTVETPGLGHRGVRRIVTGGQPPASYHYTDDHYASFQRFEVDR